MDKIKNFNKVLKKLKSYFLKIVHYLNEKIVEHSMCTNLINEKVTLEIGIKNYLQKNKYRNQLI